MLANWFTSITVIGLITGTLAHLILCRFSRRYWIFRCNMKHKWQYWTADKPEQRADPEWMASKRLAEHVLYGLCCACFGAALVVSLILWQSNHHDDVHLGTRAQANYEIRH